MSSRGTIPPPETQISQAERWEISDQLSRVLMSPWFRSSSRSSQLLRHVVEVSIHGQTDRLRERQIAIEAFHRKSTYDNNSDPIVRVAAGEVRKRLAQYYDDSKNSGELRIELPVGSYVPVFHFATRSGPLADDELPATPEDLFPLEAEPVLPDLESGATLVPQLPSQRSRWWLWSAVVVLFVASFWLWRGFTSIPKPSTFDNFWSPLLSSPYPPLISVGELRAHALMLAPSLERSYATNGMTIDLARQTPGGVPVQRIAYVEAVARITGVLGSKHRSFDVRGQSQTTFADISGRPVILLGSYDNNWALGMFAGMGGRFQFKTDPAKGLVWISDRDHPNKPVAVTDMFVPEPTTYEAFSVVVRQTGKLSQQTRLLLAGATDEGTIAAAEFVSNPKYLDDFATQAPKGWEKKNIEFLLETRVIENVIGIPRIIAYNTW